MRRPYTSIIVTAYDLTQVLRNITLASIGTLIKNTPEEDFELIFMDTIPRGCEGLRWFDDLDVIQLGKRTDRVWVRQYLSEMANPGQYGSMNIGAGLASGDYLCFLQNDVLVPEGWLDDLRYYLDHDLADAVFPDQSIRTYTEMQILESLDYEDDKTIQGKRDAGLMLVKREVFEKVGGWNDKIRVFFGEKDIYQKIPRQRLTNKVNITHVDSATYWTRKQLEEDQLNEEITESTAVVNTAS